MAACRPNTFSLDPEFLLSLAGDESESEDEFDGWLGPDDGLTPLPTEERATSRIPPQQRSRSHCYPEGICSASSKATEISQMSPTQFLMQQPPSSAPSPIQNQQPQISTPLQCNTAANAKLSPPTFTASPGIVPSMKGKEPIDFFRLMFDEHVVDLILTETNRYATQYLKQEKKHLHSHPNARAHEWHKTEFTAKEVEAFIALVIAMGICGFPTLR